jgi:hypothetical protein
MPCFNILESVIRAGSTSATIRGYRFHPRLVKNGLSELPDMFQILLLIAVMVLIVLITWKMKDRD